MNDKTRSIIALSLIAGVSIGEPIFNIAKTVRTMRKAREEIHHNGDLDVIAIRRANEAVKAELKAGLYDDLSFDEMMRKMLDRFEFEKIAVRLEN
jgi:hypothetical protein